MQRRAAHCAVPRTSAMMHRPSSVKLFSSSDRPESFAEPRSNSACGKGNAPSACVAISGAELLCGELLCCADHCRRVRVVETDRVQQDGLQRLAIGHSDKRLRRRQCRVRCGAARQSSTAEQHGRAACGAPAREHGGFNAPRIHLVLDLWVERCKLPVARQVECHETRVGASHPCQQLRQLFSRVDGDALWDCRDARRRRGGQRPIESAHERRDLHGEVELPQGPVGAALGAFEPRQLGWLPLK